MAENYFLGVDVGTGSVRAALVRSNGYIVRASTWPIKTWNPLRHFYEQSSDDIWKSCSAAIKAVSESIDPNLIKGIGFDATCSLVCIGPDGQPLTVSPTGHAEQNVILWMDHRSNAEAEFINDRQPDVLEYVGGKMSPEMQTPKLMWLKKNLKKTWSRAKYFFDLVDFLTWKATGDDSRSLCTVVCKWTYVVETDKDEGGWDKNYFSLIGLSDLLHDDAVKIGSRIKIPGEKCGSGLTAAAAKDFGLLPGTSVAAGLIDAHAGGLGLLIASAPGMNPSLETKLAMICGTSTCHMVVSQSPKMIPGIWGPYFNVVVPNMYLNEAGQSATGKLIDFIVETHSIFSQLKKFNDKTEIYDYMNDLLTEMTAVNNLPSSAWLTSQIHIWPDFHGNRSPLADPSLLGMISGLHLTEDENDLAIKYLATIQALAYGTKHILETLQHHGYDQLSAILMGGGLSKNRLFAQIHADVIGMPVLLPKTPEPVLLGAAILGMVAARHWKDVEEAMKNMIVSSHVFIPSEIDREYHLKKYRVFLKMVEDQKSYQAIMTSETSQKKE